MKAPMKCPLYQCFVSPLNAHYLTEAGLTLTTPYTWKIRGNEAVLYTTAFDLDMHYKMANANVDFVFPCRYIPAFQLADMEKLVPDYLLNRTGNIYTLRCDDMFKMDEEQDEHLPDVFAKMILQGFKKRILQAQTCIQILTAQ